jgi:hypothetical protein
VKLVALRPDQLWVSPELDRSRKDRQFEERLRASIDRIGLVEPLKVAATGEGRYLIVDGVMRWRAIEGVRSEDRKRFVTVPAYVVSHDRRFEIRYQTDIYQDLLPSQLAALVEHLHQNDHIQKTQIAAYIGVSAPTLRNYTGLWRLMQRGGLFARIVDLMDVGVVPSSNPYAWLRLTEQGLRAAIECYLSDGDSAEDWVDGCLREAMGGHIRRLSLLSIEAITGRLPAMCYREGEDVRSRKRALGLRRARQGTPDSADEDLRLAMKNLRAVAKNSDDSVLQLAARSLQAFLG